MQIARKVMVRCRSLLPCLLLASLLSCGGGTQQIEPFQARQVIYIGDETVGLLADGRRYGINPVDANNALVCDQLPIWSQQVAANFGFATDVCSPGSRGVTQAAANAKAADIEAQISRQLATGITDKDLYIVMVGLNDIIDLYENYQGDRSCDPGARNPGGLMGEADARGRLVAAQVSRILAADGRAIVSTVHDVGYTPYALAKEVVAPGSQALLSCLTARFNARVRVDIRPLDGRLWGLVLADDDTLAAVRNPGNFGFVNTTSAACAVASPDCTTNTLVGGANAGNFLWADDRHFGPVFHNQLAAQAITRARNNPF